jgi:hypothetical protein
MPIPAIDPDHDGDVFRMGIRTHEAQIDHLLACLIEDHVAVVDWIDGSSVTDRKITGWDLPFGRLDLLAGGRKTSTKAKTNTLMKPHHIVGSC